MLVELAIGDAYGAGFEYVSARVVREGNDLSRYVRHPRHGRPPGTYTDDTQMSLAIAEALLDGLEWTKPALADYFVRAFKRDEREGYSRHFHALLCEIQSGDELLARIRPDSDKSGAAMRAGPIGVLHDPAEVARRARVQAEITHDTPGGVNAATAAALTNHYFVHRHGPKAGLPGFLTRWVEHPWSSPWTGRVDQRGMSSVHAAVSCIARTDSLSELLRQSVALTGDTDTVATIALGAASSSQEHAADLPEHLWRDLEDGPFGRSYLEALDPRLLALSSH